jgi:hypothetical protein
MIYQFRGQVTKDFEESGIKEGQWISGNLVYKNGKPYIVGNFVEVNDEYTILEYWYPVERETLKMEKVI